MRTAFNENYLIIKSCFPGEYGKKHALGAFLFLLNGSDAQNVIRMTDILECREILKRRLGRFTAFRDYLQLPLVIKMAVAEDPEKYLEGLVNTYNRIMPTYFTGTGQRFITAMSLYDNCSEENLDSNFERMYEIFEYTKASHPILTGQEDMMFAAILAADGEDVESVTEEMEKCFNILKPKFRLKNPLQGVSHILALTDRSPEEKTGKFLNLLDAVKRTGLRFGTGPQMIILAVLSVLDIAAEEAAFQIKEIYDYLKKNRYIGKLGFSAQTRIMIATAMTAASNMQDNNIIHDDVRIGILRTVLTSSMTGGMILADSILDMSSHR
ncbi:MAG: DUF4003 family protein [Parasporobacterium sp.]|nr:DUF4003 family protein [Parasporobacterium sp.]